ncbi:MAG: folate-binding protein YgfZ [Rhodospirillaceae bacterium]|nr:folate-binding protein YgfZ [Rhodospirillaceae bacterium]
MHGRRVIAVVAPQRKVAAHSAITLQPRHLRRACVWPISRGPSLARPPLSTLSFAPLSHRALVAVRGEDRGAFLQGLVTADVRNVEAGLAAWSAFLTPQGKFLHEFFMFTLGDAIWLECERARRDDLISRLSKYKLRAKVTLEAVDVLAVGTAWGRNVEAAFGLRSSPGVITPLGAGVVFTDPRLLDAGVRWALLADNAAAVLKELGLKESTPAEYDALRFALGLPDGSRDMDVEKALLLENGFDELNGIDYKKGCYVGQELTARTHYRALIKKRLLPVSLEGSVPPGTPLVAEGQEAGEMKSSADGEGLALVRLDAWRGAPDGVLTAGHVKVTPHPAGWMKLPSE